MRAPFQETTDSPFRRDGGERVSSNRFSSRARRFSGPAMSKSMKIQCIGYRFWRKMDAARIAMRITRIPASSAIRASLKRFPRRNRSSRTAFSHRYRIGRIERASAPHGDSEWGQWSRVWRNWPLSLRPCLTDSLLI